MREFGFREVFDLCTLNKYLSFQRFLNKNLFIKSGFSLLNIKLCLLQ